MSRTGNHPTPGAHAWGARAGELDDSAKAARAEEDGRVNVNEITLEELPREKDGERQKHAQREQPKLFGDKVVWPCGGSGWRCWS